MIGIQLDLNGNTSETRSSERSSRSRPKVVQTIVAADPARCRIWSLHSRLGENITASTCSDEIESFKSQGQLVPALGRRLVGDPDHDFELIYGARRLFVARHLNVPIQIDVREVDDRDGIIAMDIENRLRKDISPYERGLSYAKWLRTKYFESQDDIAQALHVSPSQISRLLRLAKLPAVVVDAFRDPADICENWGLEIMDALDDPEKRPAVVRTARAMGGDAVRLPARDVYRKLLTAAVRGRKLKTESHDRVVLGFDGTPLFRIRYQTNSVALILPREDLKPDVLEEIELILSDVLQQFHPPAEFAPVHTGDLDLGEISSTPTLEIHAP